MPKRKITPELWSEILDAYNAWDPAITHTTIEDLLRPFGISKQAFYAERRRQGIPTRSEWRKQLPQPGTDKDALEALVEALVEARMRIKELERQLSLRQ